MHCRFRGLLSVHSRYGLHAHRVAYATFYTEGFSSFVASAAASVATGWNEPVPGRDFSPAEDQRLFTAHSELPTNRELSSWWLESNPECGCFRAVPNESRLSVGV